MLMFYRNKCLAERGPNTGVVHLPPISFPLCLFASSILNLHNDGISQTAFFFFFQLLIYCSYPLSLLHFVNKMQVMKVPSMCVVFYLH